MNKTLMSVLMVLLVGVMPVAAAQVTQLSLDEAGMLATRIETDTTIKTEGNGSIKITTAWPTTISLAEVSGLNLDETKLVYRARVKAEGLEGMALLEMWVQVKGQSYYSRGMQSTIDGTTDWRTLETPFLLKGGDTVDQVTLNIVINGKGSVWVDDVTLSTEPLPLLPQ